MVVRMRKISVFVCGCDVSICWLGGFSIIFFFLRLCMLGY